ncbi:hypothetical protein MOP88_02135 [Sphingomonas sp. WKB10]|nr:hypothetical protein [Sphingomonas sp. WKB10]
MKAGLRLSLGLAMALVLTGAGAAPAQVEHYAVREGLNVNSFTRAGPVAAHVVLRSGKQPACSSPFRRAIAAPLSGSNRWPRTPNGGWRANRNR